MVFKWSMPFSFVAAAFRSGAAWIFGLRTLTTPDEQDARLVHCHRCSQWIEGQCRLCGCFTEAKTALTMEQCPIKRWKRIWRGRSK